MSKLSLLSGAKRKSAVGTVRSAYDPKRTNSLSVQMYAVEDGADIDFHGPKSCLASRPSTPESLASNQLKDANISERIEEIHEIGLLLIRESDGKSLVVEIHQIQ